MKRIFLVGFMGSGKTTLGRAYAKAEELEFIDLDWYIEERFHKEVRQLFAEHGEKGFREIEQNMLKEVAQFENVIIACGGGTPCFFDNMDYMNGMGQTIFLNAHPEILFRRLSVAKKKRPLLANKNNEELKQFIRESLDKRGEFYRKAHIVFNADLLDTHEQIHDSVERLRTLLEEKEG